MPSRRNQVARRNPDNIRDMRNGVNKNSFETRNTGANYLENVANYGREGSGAFMRKADKNRIRTAARQVRLDAASKSQNNYEFGTKEQVQAQHRSTYRDLRKAFGMSAG